MSDDMVTIQVDGASIQAVKGSMLIEATDKAGIKIPRFCYHEKLSVAANCRMCLVEVDKVPKPLPACATPVMDGMVVHTKSPRAIAAQKGTMEFLLINHPLDCPICDQGGECELQDVSIGYGDFDSRYVEKKRVVKEKNIGPLVATDMTRCIHCTRCVRFGDEIAGSRELGATGRGEHTEIGTYIQKNLNSELSGNVIDLCPVGALTSKPFRYTARAWEMSQKDSIAAHDCVGSNISVHLRRKEVLRVVPKNNDAINECWISDRDRFSYEGLVNERLSDPKIKQNGQWKTVTWDEALEFVANGLSEHTKASADEVGALVSPVATVEEGYLLQKLMRAMGVKNIDSRIRQSDFSDTQTPWIGQKIAELANLDAALLVESNMRTEQPMLSHRIRQAALNGAEVSRLSSVAHPVNFDHHEQLLVSPKAISEQLAAIANAMAEIAGETLSSGVADSFPGVEVTESAKRIAQSLHSGDKSAILLGSMATAHPEYGLIRNIGIELARLSGAKFGVLSDGPNTTGLNLVNAIPDAGAKNAADMMIGAMKAMVVYNFEPSYDCYDGQAMLKMLNEADLVVEFAMYENSEQAAYADVLLPITPNTETSGTFVNCEGSWQSFQGVVAPHGNSRPGWKVLRVLGNLNNIDGFDYMSSTDVLDEAKENVASIEDYQGDDNWVRQMDGSASISRIGQVSPYAIDAVVRRADALQQTESAASDKIRLNSRLASELGLSVGDEVSVEQGAGSVKLSVQTDDFVADGCAVVSSYTANQGALGSLYGEISVKK